MRQAIQALRPCPRLSIKGELLFSCLVALLGLVMGFVAKATDSVSVIGEIGTELGVWVFAAALIAAYSRHVLCAAANVLVFFLCVLASYYLYGYFVLGFFPKAYFVGWLAVAMGSPLPGALLWFSRARGAVGAVLSALPAAVLFHHGYPAFYTHRFSLFFSLTLGVSCCLLLPRTAKQKALAAAGAITLAVALYALRGLGLFPF